MSEFNWRKMPLRSAPVSINYGAVENACRNVQVRPPTLHQWLYLMDVLNEHSFRDADEMVDAVVEQLINMNQKKGLPDA